MNLKDSAHIIEAPGQDFCFCPVRTFDTHSGGRGAGVWKMVTGLVEAGEDITVAAEREVLEETGVRAKFDAVLAFRQAHGFAFGKSDFFFVIALR